jgi:hypothetical protein
MYVGGHEAKRSPQRAYPLHATGRHLEPSFSLLGALSGAMYSTLSSSAYLDFRFSSSASAASVIHCHLYFGNRNEDSQIRAYRKYASVG